MSLKNLFQVGRLGKGWLSQGNANLVFDMCNDVTNNLPKLEPMW